MTSSKTSSAPASRVSSRRNARKLVRRGQHAAGAEHRLDDDRRQVVQVRLERRQRSLDVVERRDDERLGDRGPGCPARPARRPTLAGNARRVVVGPVVAAREDADLLPAGEGSRRAERQHRRLGAGVREADQLDARQALTIRSASSISSSFGAATLISSRGLALHRLDDPRMAVAEDQRRVVRDEVDALDAVHVPDAAALAAGDVDGIRVVEDRRPRVAARQRAERALPQLSAACIAPFSPVTDSRVMAHSAG